MNASDNPINFEGEDDDPDVLIKAFDYDSGAFIKLISCPPEALGGDYGPVFEHMDNKNVFVLISENLFQETMDEAPNAQMGAMRCGIIVGDVMRRGMFYAQNMNKKPNNKRRDTNEQ